MKLSRPASATAIAPLLALTALLLAGCATPFEKRLAEAQKGNRRAQYDVAMCYATGRGIGPKGEKAAPNPAEAVRWLEQAADKEGDACLALGLSHYYRQGVRDDWDTYQRAFFYIKKAVDKKVPGALYWLGECYLKGRGVKQDVQKAIECFKQCALEKTDGGRPSVQAAASMAKLGNIYLHGTGVYANYKDCSDWFQRAKKAGDKGAAAILDNLSRDYFNKVQGMGDNSDGGNASLYEVESAGRDSERDVFSICAIVAKGANAEKARDILMEKVLARCENDLIIQVPGLGRDDISWKWRNAEITKERKIELELLWYYLHVIPGSEKYDKGRRIGSLTFDTAFIKDSNRIERFVASEINAFCSTKLAAVTDGVIPKGAMYKEHSDQRKRSGPDGRLLTVTFDVLN